MLSDDDDELIESNSSECSPPRDTQLSLSSIITKSNSITNNNNNNNNKSFHSNFNQDNATKLIDHNNDISNVKFDKLFEDFVEANTVKSICKCFQNITDSLNINTKQIFENGYFYFKKKKLFRF